MSESNAPWISLSARVIRVALARKDVGYSELSKRLPRCGIHDDEKALASRVAIGRVRLEDFLKILFVIDAELPPSWSRVIERSNSWETWAKEVMEAELAEAALVTVDSLARDLSALGATFTLDTLASRIVSGRLSLPDFLKCTVALRSRSLDPFIERRDLVAEARAVLVRKDAGKEEK